MGSSVRSGASFRDPSGFLFVRDGTLFRQVNQSYRATFDQLEHSGLYAELVEAGLLIPHALADVAPAEPKEAALVLRPDPVAFISYPYEWRDRKSTRLNSSHGSISYAAFCLTTEQIQ